MKSEIEMESRIKNIVRERAMQYKAMTRQQLKEEFQQVTGNEPHPRFAKEWLVTALSRVFQNKTWCDVAGYIPKDIAESDMKFWMSNSVYLVKKETAAQERKKSRTKEKIVEQQPSNNIGKDIFKDVPFDQLCMTSKGIKNPFKNSRSEKNFHRFYDHLGETGLMDFDGVSDWCKKSTADMDPEMIYVEFQHRDIVTFSIKGQESNIVDDLPFNSETDCDEDSMNAEVVSIPSIDTDGWIGRSEAEGEEDTQDQDSSDQG